MSEKIFWFDTETTGIDCKINSMVQLAALVEIDGKIEDEVNLFFQPLPNRVINPEALEVNKRTIEEINTFPPAESGIKLLKSLFDKYVDKYDKNDKFVPAGFRVDFDCDFLRETWFQAGDKYGPGSYIFNCSLDVRSMVSELIIKTGLRLPNYKLETICKHYWIDIAGAHNALVDIKATRELYLLSKAILSNEKFK